jgi:solute carrier family 25 uncoupling protein 8/9
MRSDPRGEQPSVLVKFVSAGLAASIAEAVTIPIDTAKVRLQVNEDNQNILYCQ